MHIEKYTERTRGFVQSAQSLAIREGHQQFTPEHVLKVLLDDEEGLAAGLIERAGGRPRDALRHTELALAKLPKVQGSAVGQSYLAPATARVFDNAEKIAQKAGDSYVTVERLLLALAMEKSTDAGKILDRAGVTPQTLNAAIEDLRKGRTADNPTAENAYDALKKYARDLTEEARQGMADPVFGREEEIRQIIQVLSRRTKHNAILIGEPGVGKRAIVNALALRIIDNNVPDTLCHRKLISLDKDSLRAGVKNYAELQSNLESVINGAADYADGVIVFESELDVLLTDFSDVSRSLRSMLVKGDMRFITAMTPTKYQKTIRTSEILSQHFQPIEINELSIESSISTLRLLKEKFELYHGLRISDGAIVEAVSLSRRYITDRLLPDKAIDIVDEAASRLRMQVDLMPEELDELYRQIIQLTIEKEALKNETDSASKERLKKLSRELRELEEKSASLTARWHAEKEKEKLGSEQKLKVQLEAARNELCQVQRRGEYQRAGELAYGVIPGLEKRLAEIEETRGGFLVEEAVITADHVAQVVSRWTGESVEDIKAGKDLIPRRQAQEISKRSLLEP